MAEISAVIDWMNLNSGAIQAIATVVLVAVTWQYARLTGAIAQTGADAVEAQNAMLALQRQARDSRRRELGSLAASVGTYLRMLPTQVVSPEEVRDAPVWATTDLERLRMLASEFDSATADSGAIVALSCRFLAEFVAAVNSSTKHGRPFQATPDDIQRWKQEHEVASRNLTRLLVVAVAQGAAIESG